jgi:hypothetical protein
VIQAKHSLVGILAASILGFGLVGCNKEVDATKLPDAPPPPATEADFPIMKDLRKSQASKDNAVKKPTSKTR